MINKNHFQTIIYNYCINLLALIQRDDLSLLLTFTEIILCDYLSLRACSENRPFSLIGVETGVAGKLDLKKAPGGFPGKQTALNPINDSLCSLQRQLKRNPNILIASRNNKKEIFKFHTILFILNRENPFLLLKNFRKNISKEEENKSSCSKETKNYLDIQKRLPNDTENCFQQPPKENIVGFCTERK